MPKDGARADSGASAIADAFADVIVDADAGLAPGPPSLLATSAGKDEDPFLLRAKDGTFYLFWYSNRDGHDRIWLKSSPDGRAWSVDRAITPPEEANFDPSAIQASDRAFHLVTWHGAVIDGGTIGGGVRYATSSDTMTWSAGTALTDSASLSWAPTIAEQTPGKLVVAWSSNAGGDKDLYVRRSPNAGAAWDAPTQLVAPTTNDDLPCIVTRQDGSLLLAYQRYAAAETAFDAPFGAADNELAFVTSTDGTTFSSPFAITSDPIGSQIPDVTASLFRGAGADAWSVAWASVRGKSGTGDISAMPLGSAPATAANVTQLTDIAGSDYSPRLLPLGQGLYLMAWVSDRSGNLEIYSQVLSL